MGRVRIFSSRNLQIDLTAHESTNTLLEGHPPTPSEIAMMEEPRLGCSSGAAEITYERSNIRKSTTLETEYWTDSTPVAGP